VKVSIIIPTYNRASLLPITIDSFLVQNYLKEEYEIIICNNNSTDNTSKVINKYCKKYHNVKSVIEERQGVHYARNTAAKIAKGEILYFTDDDMVADENMLSSIISLFDLNENIGVATGQVLPKWQQTPPKWVEKYCLNHFLSLRRTDNCLCISKNDVGVYSCHQAILREAFFRSGGFNPENTKGEWIGDGETGLNMKIKKLGYYFAETNESIIYHMIPKERMTQKYLNKRLANQGNCDSYTCYRQYVPNKLQLLKLVILSFIKMTTFFLKFLTRFFLIKDSWHMHLAYSFYFWNRIKYDIRLMHDDEWRKLVLIDNWLNE